MQCWSITNHSLASNEARSISSLTKPSWRPWTLLRGRERQNITERKKENKSDKCEMHLGAKRRGKRKLRVINPVCWNLFSCCLIESVFLVFITFIDTFYNINVYKEYEMWLYDAKIINSSKETEKSHLTCNLLLLMFSNQDGTFSFMSHTWLHFQKCK